MTDKWKGIGWFLLQCFSVSITLAVVRFAMAEINIFVMVFIQSCFSFIMMMPIIFGKGIRNGFGYLKTSRPVLHVTRTVLGLAGTSCFFYGATKIPLNDATAISFTGPLFTTLAAIIILREKAKKHRMIGLIIGFIGALIVIRPAGDMFNPNVVYIIITVILMGIVQILISMLNKTEPAQRMLFYMIFLSLIMMAPFAFANWITPSAATLGWIFMLSICTYINVYSIIRAYKYTEISTLMPLDFTRLIFISIVAYLIFDEHLSPVTVVGSLIILSGVIYVLAKERKHKEIPEL